MRICSPQYGLDQNSSAGGEVYDARILDELARQGHEIDVILPPHKHTQNTKGWNIYHTTSSFWSRSFAYNFTLIPALKRIWRESRFDVIRVHSPYFVGIGAWIFKKLYAPRVPIVATYHHLEASPAFNLIDYLFIRKWDAIITDSRFSKNAIMKRFGVNPNIIHVIHAGISTIPPAHTTNTSATDFKLTFCGALIPRKNVSFLLDVVAKTDIPLSLTIIGDGPQRKKLERKTRAMGIEEMVRFTGKIERKEKDALIAGSDLFVFPSRMEGFGLAPLEAMALGTPALVSNRGSLPEVIGEGGIVIELSKHAWKHELERLYDHRDELPTLSLKAQRRAREFTWEKTGKETSAVYEQFEKKNPLIYIAYQTREGAWGGGNQFIKALRKEWKRMGYYTDSPANADIILFNSFENISRVIKLKRRHPSTLFIHRVDGPISLVRGKDAYIDRFIFSINKEISGGTIFQSQWSQEQSRAMGMKPSAHETVIYNAPDNDLFCPRKKQGRAHMPARVIITSWSQNKRKGFDTYRYIDQHIDTKKFSVTFMGRSPVTFSHIHTKEAGNSQGVAKELKKHDIYLTASQTEPCSNALIEALSCGLPAVALKSGGHPELLGKGGKLFTSPQEALEKLELVAQRYEQYENKLPSFSIARTAQEYYNFAFSVWKQQRGALIKTQGINWKTYQYAGIFAIQRLWHRLVRK